MTLHLTLVVLLPSFAVLTWWQADRALGGNSLSWAYTFEWPFFGGYAVYLWWWLIHSQDKDRAAASSADDAATVATAAADAGAHPGAERAPGLDIPVPAHASNGVAADDDRFDTRVGEIDEELAAYNDYLAALNASGRRKRW